jgi:AraC-like DNA-binding protein
MVLSQTSKDAVGHVLDSVRVAGAVLSLAILEAPFTVTSDEVPTGVFHAILDGEAWAGLEGAAPRRLVRGEVALFSSGSPHVISHAERATAAPVPVAAGGDGPIPIMRVDNGGPETRILCGTITFDQSPVWSPAAALPPMMVTGGHHGAWVASTVDLIADELSVAAVGSDVVARRLADVLVIRALRETLADGDVGPGWVAGLQDPELSMALGALHRDPALRWTAASLAHEAHMSRSAFYQRFTQRIGIPPAAYVAQWRMHVACRLLASSTVSVEEIGRRVGFLSAAAFATAFKRSLGVTPSAHRRRSRVDDDEVGALA